ncbi:MAG TPA: putative lipid II flippase FtsW [Acidimicrobiales bacterium]|nr:putative lipid II flippase FtsW [Acidimicrobiales bacterium]
MSTTLTRARSGERSGDRRDNGARRRRGPTGRRGVTAAGWGMFLALAFLVTVFNLLGLVMVMSASSVVALDEYGSSWHFVSRQAAWAGAGAIALVLLARADYHRWRRLASPLLVLSLVLLVAALVPGVGVSANGASRWIGLGPLTFQPAELAKLALVVWVADLLARRASRMRNTRATLRPVIVVLAVMATLLMLQPNLGTTLVLVAVALALCYVAGAPLGPLARWSVASLGAAVTLALAAPYRRARVFTFLDPWADPLDTGYQGIQALVGLADGGLAGTGLGASRAKWGFLPYAHTDFIFAIVGEELGLVGATVVVGLFVLLLILGIRVALHAPDRFGFLLAVGVTAWFGMQAFVNIGAVIGILPITGVPLPFVSAGGSSLLFSMAAAGLLLAVARQARARR